jgi:hypothetical protein
MPIFLPFTGSESSGKLGHKIMALKSAFSYHPTDKTTGDIKADKQIIDLSVYGGKV